MFSYLSYLNLRGWLKLLPLFSLTKAELDMILHETRFQPNDVY